MNSPVPPSSSIMNRLRQGNVNKASIYFLNIIILITPIATWLILLTYKQPTFLNPNAVAQVDMIKALLTGNISSIFNGVWGNILIPTSIIIHKITHVDIETALLLSYQLSGTIFIYSLIFLVKKLKFNLNIQILFTILISFIIAKIIKTSIISPDLILSALIIFFYLQYDKWSSAIDRHDFVNKKTSLLLLALCIFCSDQIAFLAIVLYLIAKLAIKFWLKPQLKFREIVGTNAIKGHIELIIQIVAIGAIFSSVFIVKYNQWHPLPLIRFNNQLGRADKVNDLHPLSSKKLQSLNSYNYFSNWDDPSTMTLTKNNSSVLEILKTKITNLNDNLNQSPNFISNVVALGAYLFLLSIVVLAVLIARAAYYRDKNIKYLIEIYIIALLFIILYAMNYVEIRHFYLISSLSVITIFYALNIIFLNPQYSWIVTVLALIMIRLNSVGLNFERYKSSYTSANNSFWQNENMIKSSAQEAAAGASNLEPSSGLEIWADSYVKNMGSVDTLTDQYWPEKIDGLKIDYFIYQQEVNHEIVSSKLLQMGFIKEKTFESNGINIYLYIRPQQL